MDRVVKRCNLLFDRARLPRYAADQALRCRVNVSHGRRRIPS